MNGSAISNWSAFRRGMGNTGNDATTAQRVTTPAMSREPRPATAASQLGKVPELTFGELQRCFTAGQSGRYQHVGE
jgi:hypothetical protein